MRYAVALLLLAASLAFVDSAAAKPPLLSSVAVTADFHLSVQFAAPLADELEICVASEPDRRSDGSFVSQNIVEQVAFTTDVIQAGRWTDISQLDLEERYDALLAERDRRHLRE